MSDTGMNEIYFRRSSAAIESRLADLLSRMTLDEKIGQMTQAERSNLAPEKVGDFFLGSVLSGGGGSPPDNTPSGWLEMVGAFQKAALGTRLGIPILYGVDAVHGHNNLHGAVIFPHNIGLGATHDPDLVWRIGRATAEEIAATGVNWNFAPTVAVPQDLRWGRAYEGFSEDSRLVSELGSAYIRGLQGDNLDDPQSVIATAKHFVGDGGTRWGTSFTLFPIPPGSHFEGKDGLFRFWIDRGDTQVDERTFREIHLSPYSAALQAGARIVMASFSSWNGEKMHTHHHLLTEVLKGEMGFSGFVVSDWAGIEEASENYFLGVVSAINAGIDMGMVPVDFERFISTLRRAVENGDIPLERIDDAVKRILRVKFEMGLFERPLPDPGVPSPVGTAEHRELARQAVAKSLVLLKNDGQTLPIPKSAATIFIGGQAADDIGLQCGGWTIEWLGKAGEITPGVTILNGLRSIVSPETRVEFDPDGRFNLSQGQLAEVGIAILAEMPYAEGFGDRADLSLPEGDVQLIERMRAVSKKLVVVLLSGRPLILTGQLPMMDALVAAWLPGSEGQGVADVLFGDQPFAGRLPYSWPRSMDQIPLQAGMDPLFPLGYGLETSTIRR